MVTKKEIAEVMRELGRRKSERKAKAAREAGKKGGRPRLCRVCGSKMKRTGKLEYYCSKCRKAYLFRFLIWLYLVQKNLTARFSQLAVAF